MPSNRTLHVPHAAILLARLFFFAGRGFHSLPRIAPVEHHSHIAARVRRATKTQLTPRARVRVVRAADVVQHLHRKEHRARHALPCLAPQLAVLHVVDERVLRVAIDASKRQLVTRAAFGIGRREAHGPCVGHRRHAGVAEAFAAPCIIFASMSAGSGL
jgi:hypothetical protein